MKDRRSCAISGPAKGVSFVVDLKADDLGLGSRINTRFSFAFSRATQARSLPKGLTDLAALERLLRS